MEDRDKWRRFFSDHPQAMETPFHPGDRFGTVGKLIDHIFLVERRHLQRLRGEALADRTGLTGNNAPPLFDYGASVRRELEQYVDELDEDVAAQIRTFEVRDQQWPMSARKLLFHMSDARDPPLGTDRPRRPPRGPRTSRRSRSVLQPGAAMIERLARLGYASKALVYAIIGTLAIARRHQPGRSRHRHERRVARGLLAQPYGRVLLLVLGVGLCGYAVWRLLDSFFDPDRHGTEFKGLVTRIGNVVRGVIYGALGLEALRLFRGSGGSKGDEAEAWTSRIMDLPLGEWLIGHRRRDRGGLRRQ